MKFLAVLALLIAAVMAQTQTQPPPKAPSKSSATKKPRQKKPAARLAPNPQTHNTTGVPTTTSEYLVLGGQVPNSGGGTGSGTVNPGIANEIAIYPTTGTAVAGDPLFTDDSLTLTYRKDTDVLGTGTYEDLLYVYGAYIVDSPPAASPMAPSAVGRSSMGISNDGNFYLTVNGSTPSILCTPANAACGVASFAGDLSGTSTSQNVIGIQSHPLPALSSGYLHWNGTAWVMDSPVTTFGGDLSGTASSQNVIGIRSQPLPALTSGYLHWNGTAWVMDSPVYSMGGSNTQVQFNNNGVLGGISNAPAGTLFQANGMATPASFTNEIAVTDSQSGNDPTDRRWGRFVITTDSSTSTPGSYSNENGLELWEQVQNGQALYTNAAGTVTRGKKTFKPLAITGFMQGAGQRFLLSENQNCYPSESDCFAETRAITYQNTPITGDEGTGYQSVSTLSQPTQLNGNSMSSVTTTTCNTTTTQILSASSTAQAFTVASTTGCNVNDWVVLGREVATGSPQESAMQITAVAGGTISGVVVGNYPSGTTVTPATLIQMTIGAPTPWGQGGVVVNLTEPSYTTGTVSSITGAAFTGSGTTWTNSMVGGDATLPGCITLAADTFNGAPFNGSGQNGPLNTWYRITGVSSNTALSMLSWSTAGDAAYHGYGPGTGGYTIRPCAKVLQVLVGLSSSQVVLETNTFPWAANDVLEEAIGAYPDVTGFRYSIGQKTAGGVRRAFMNIVNSGARTFNTGFNLTGNMLAGSNADTVPWAVGYQCAGCTQGFVTSTTTATNSFGMLTVVNGSSSGRVGWQIPGKGAAIGTNLATGYMELDTLTYNPTGTTVTQGSTTGSYVFNTTDPLGASTLPATGQYVGNLDVVRDGSAHLPRLGLQGVQSTWFLQPKESGVTCYSMQVFNNQNGGAQGAGAGEVGRFNTCNQLIMDANGAFVGTEGNAPTFNKGAGLDDFWADATAHRWKMTNNGSAADTVAAFSDNLGVFASGGAIAPASITTPGQITSTLATGTAPLSVTSTTPVPNLSAGVISYNHNSTQQFPMHFVADRCTLGTDCAVTLTGSAAFTASNTYNCVGNDQTGTQSVKFVPTSGTQFAMTGTGTDVLSYICIGW
jgi:hypothetical protein